MGLMLFLLFADVPVGNREGHFCTALCYFQYRKAGDSKFLSQLDWKYLGWIYISQWLAKVQHSRSRAEQSGSHNSLDAKFDAAKALRDLVNKLLLDRAVY